MPGLGTDPSSIQVLLSGWSTSSPGAAGGDGTATAPCTNCRCDEVVLVTELAAGLVLVTVLLLLFGCAWWSVSIILSRAWQAGEDDAARRVTKKITIVTWEPIAADWSVGARERQIKCGFECMCVCGFMENVSNLALFIGVSGALQLASIYICYDNIAVSKWFLFRLLENIMGWRQHIAVSK